MGKEISPGNFLVPGISVLIGFYPSAFAPFTALCVRNQSKLTGNWKSSTGCESSVLRAGLDRFFRTGAGREVSVAWPLLKKVCLMRRNVSVVERTSASGTTAVSKVMELSLACRAAANC